VALLLLAMEGAMEGEQACTRFSLSTVIDTCHQCCYITYSVYCGGRLDFKEARPGQSIHRVQLSFTCSCQHSTNYHGSTNREWCATSYPSAAAATAAGMAVPCSSGAGNVHPDKQSDAKLFATRNATF
jgi:hypothetical protein